MTTNFSGIPRPAKVIGQRSHNPLDASSPCVDKPSHLTGCYGSPGPGRGINGSGPIDAQSPARYSAPGSISTRKRTV